MTAKPQVRKPSNIRPATIENRVRWVLGQHGIEPTTADSIWASLTTGDDPRPDGVPAAFTFQGVKLFWPAGVERRVIEPRERGALNESLRRAGVPATEALDEDDTAEQARQAYTVLFHRTQREGYVDTHTVEARFGALVAEATTPVEPTLHTLEAVAEEMGVDLTEDDAPVIADDLWADLAAELDALDTQEARDREVTASLLAQDAVTVERVVTPTVPVTATLTDQLDAIRALLNR